MSFPARVVVREVGLRDGLQSIATLLATERKKEWIRAAHWLEGKTLHGALWRAGLPNTLPRQPVAAPARASA